MTITPAQTRAWAHRGALLHLESLARRIEQEFPNLHIAIKITDDDAQTDPRRPRPAPLPKPAAPTRPSRRGRFSPEARAKMARAAKQRWIVAKANGWVSLAGRKKTRLAQMS